MNTDQPDGILGQVIPGGDSSSAASKRIDYPLDLTSSEDAFPQLTKILRQAQSEYALGRYAESLSLLLEKCLPKLQAKIEQLTPEAEDALQYISLGGSAYTLSAQLADRIGEIDARKDTSDAAVQYFEVLKGRRPLTASETNEYGISLHLRGDAPQAIPVLEEAAQMGSASAEAYLYLGLAAFAKDDFQLADKYLTAAGSLDPVDLEILRLETRIKVVQAIGGESQAGLLPMLIELSDQLWQANRSDEALAVFEQILEIDPQNLSTMIRKTMLLGILERFQEALDQAEQTLPLDPNNVTLVTMQGMALFFLNRNEEALASFERAYTLGLEEIPQLLNIVLPLHGRTLVNLARYEESLPILEQALQLTPNDMDLLEAKARALMMLERVDEAVVFYNQALTLDSKNIKLLVSMGLMMYTNRRYEEALAALDQAIHLDIDSIPVLAELAYTYKGMVFSVLGRNEEAIAMLDKSLAINPTSTAVLLQKGIALDALSRSDEAILVYDRILVIDPGNFEALEKKLYTLIGANRLEEALVVSDEALKVNPEGAAIYVGKGVAQFALNYFSEAVESLDRALAIGLSDLPAVMQIAVKYKGKALSKLNRYEDAIVVLAGALAYDPADVDIVEEIGMAYYTLGQYDQAVEYLAQVLQLDASKIDPYLYKAEALRQLGRYDEAIAVQDQGLALDPEHEGFFTARGYTLINLDRDAEAEEYLDRALVKNPQNTWTLSAKAWVRLRADDYKAGLALSKKCIELYPEYSWALGIYGTGLCDVAEYKKAIPLLKKASQIDTNTGWIVGNLGEAYYRLAQQTSDPKTKNKLLGQAAAAFTRAMELDEADLSYKAWLGDCLFMQGEDRHKEAYALYQKAVELAREKDNPEYSTLETLGWCYLRLACQDPAEAESMLTEAERVLVESLALRRDKPIRYTILLTKFRLALVIYLSRRYSLAVSEYERAASLVREKQELVRRGLYDRARKDLEQEVKHAGCYVQESMRHYEKIMKMLEVGK